LLYWQWEEGWGAREGKLFCPCWCFCARNVELTRSLCAWIWSSVFRPLVYYGAPLLYVYWVFYVYVSTSVMTITIWCGLQLTPSVCSKLHGWSLWVELWFVHES
jgi:hypothetical protein